jgi:hypothetical protein
VIHLSLQEPDVVDVEHWVLLINCAFVLTVSVGFLYLGAFCALFF